MPVVAFLQETARSKGLLVGQRTYFACVADLFSLVTRAVLAHDADLVHGAVVVHGVDLVRGVNFAHGVNSTSLSSQFGICAK